MSNPLYQALNGNNNPYAQIIADVQRLKQTFNGNPRDEVQRLLNSGKITQEQVNNAMSFAQQIIKSNPNSFM